MKIGSEFAAGGTRRRVALVGLAVAAMFTMFVGTAALKPSNAEAWAWKDNCTLLVTNKTGAQTNVRPILYAPALPTSPASFALYAARAITGIQTNGAFDAFTNYGLPVPSYGCHTFMNFTSPGGTVSCHADAPTTGANAFSCEGPAATKRIKDDDDIAGQIFVGGSATKKSAPEPDEPSISGGSLRSGALPGDGWKKSMDATDFGIAGKLMATGDLPASCAKDGREATPNDVDTEQVVRAGGDEGVGAVVMKFDNADQADATVGEALSDDSISCLAKLLNTDDTKVSAQPLPTAEDGVEGVQLAISRKDDDGRRPVSYLNVTGWSQGNQAAIELYETVGPAPSDTEEAEATAAVRIGN
jgi:hypothetical protein